LTLRTPQDKDFMHLGGDPGDLTLVILTVIEWDKKGFTSWHFNGDLTIIFMVILLLYYGILMGFNGMSWDYKSTYTTI